MATPGVVTAVVLERVAEELRGGASLTAAARAAGVSRESVYYAMRGDRGVFESLARARLVGRLRAIDGAGGVVAARIGDTINVVHQAGCSCERCVTPLRDHFAGLAMGGLVSNKDLRGNLTELAHWSYSIADAMLAERARKQ